MTSGRRWNLDAGLEFSEHGDMFSNLCAKCRRGAIFNHFIFMNECCPACGHRFELEEGFFIGAMILTYFVSTLLALPVLLVSIFKLEMEFPLALGLAGVFMLIVTPILYRSSKIAWIHLEERFYQAFKKKRDGE